MTMKRTTFIAFVIVIFLANSVSGFVCPTAIYRTQTIYTATELIPTRTASVSVPANATATRLRPPTDSLTLSLVAPHSASVTQAKAQTRTRSSPMTKTAEIPETLSWALSASRSRVTSRTRTVPHTDTTTTTTQAPTTTTATTTQTSTTPETTTTMTTTQTTETTTTTSSATSWTTQSGETNTTVVTDVTTDATSTLTPTENQTSTSAYNLSSSSLTEHNVSSPENTNATALTTTSTTPLTEITTSSSHTFVSTADTTLDINSTNTTSEETSAIINGTSFPEERTYTSADGGQNAIRRLLGYAGADYLASLLPPRPKQSALRSRVASVSLDYDSSNDASPRVSQWQARRFAFRAAGLLLQATVSKKGGREIVDWLRDYVDEGVVDISNDGHVSDINECSFVGTSTSNPAGLDGLDGTTTALFSTITGTPTPTPLGARHILTLRKSRFGNVAMLKIQGARTALEATRQVPLLLTISDNKFSGLGVVTPGAGRGMIAIAGFLPADSVINITHNIVDKAVYNPMESLFASDCSTLPTNGFSQGMFSFIDISSAGLGALTTLRIAQNNISMRLVAASSGWMRASIAVVGVNASLALAEGEAISIEKNKAIHLAVTVTNKDSDGPIPELSCNNFLQPFLAAAVVMIAVNGSLTAGGLGSALSPAGGRFVVGHNPDVKLDYVIVPTGGPGDTCLACWPDPPYTLTTIYVSRNASITSARNGYVAFSNNTVVSSTAIRTDLADPPTDSACDLWASRTTPRCSSQTTVDMFNNGRLSRPSGMSFAFMAASYPAPPPIAVPCNATNTSDPLDPCASGTMIVRVPYTAPVQLLLTNGGTFHVTENSFTAAMNSSAHLWSTNSIAFLSFDGGVMQSATGTFNVSQNVITLSDEVREGAGSHQNLQPAQVRNFLFFCAAEGCNHHATNTPRVIAAIHQMGGSSLAVSSSATFLFASNNVTVECYYAYQSAALWSHRQLDPTSRANPTVFLESSATLDIANNTVGVRAGTELVVANPAFASLAVSGVSSPAYSVKTYGDAFVFEFSTSSATGTVATSARSTVTVGGRAIFAVRRNQLQVRSDTRMAAVWRQGSFKASSGAGALDITGGQLLIDSNAVSVSGSHTIFATASVTHDAYIRSLGQGTAAAPSPRPRTIAFFALLGGASWTVGNGGSVTVEATERPKAGTSISIAFDDKHGVVLCNASAEPATYSTLAAKARASDLDANNRLLVGDSYFLFAHKAAVSIKDSGSVVRFGNVSVTLFGVEEARAFAFLDSAVTITSSGQLEWRDGSWSIKAYGFEEFTRALAGATDNRTRYFKPFFAIRNDRRFCPHLYALNLTTNSSSSVALPPIVDSYAEPQPFVPAAVIATAGQSLNVSTAAFFSFLQNTLLSVESATLAFSVTTRVTLRGPFSVVFWQCGGDTLKWASPFQFTDAPRLGDTYLAMLQQTDVSSLGYFTFLGGDHKTQYTPSYLLPDNINTIASPGARYATGGTILPSFSAFDSRASFSPAGWSRTHCLVRVGRGGRVVFDRVPLVVKSIFGSASIVHVVGSSKSAVTPSAVLAAVSGGQFGFTNTVLKVEGRASAAVIEVNGLGAGILTSGAGSSVRIEGNLINVSSDATVYEVPNVATSFVPSNTASLPTIAILLLPTLMQRTATRIPPPAFTPNPPLGGAVSVLRVTQGGFVHASTSGLVSFGQSKVNLSNVDVIYAATAPTMTASVRDTLINSHIYTVPTHPAFGLLQSNSPEVPVSVITLLSGARLSLDDRGLITLNANTLHVVNSRLGRRRDEAFSIKTHGLDSVASPRSLDASLIFINGTAGLFIAGHSTLTAESNRGQIAVASDTLNGTPIPDTSTLRTSYGLASILSISHGGVLLTSNRRSSLSISSNVLELGAGSGNAAFVASWNAQQWGSTDISVISIGLNTITFSRDTNNRAGALVAFAVSGTATRFVLYGYSTLCVSHNTFAGATGFGLLEAYLWRRDIRLQVRENTFTNVVSAGQLQATMTVDTPPSNRFWQNTYALFCNNTATPTGSLLPADMIEYFASRGATAFSLFVGQYLPTCRTMPDCELVGTASLTHEPTESLTPLRTYTETGSHTLSQTVSLVDTFSSTPVWTSTYTETHTLPDTPTKAITNSRTLHVSGTESYTLSRSVSLSGTASLTQTLMPTTWCERIYNKSQFVEWFEKSLEGPHIVNRTLRTLPLDPQEIELSSAPSFNVTDDDIRNGTAINNLTLPLPVPTSFFTAWRDVRATIMLERMVFSQPVFGHEAPARDPTITPIPSQMNPSGFGRLGTVIVNGTLHRSFNAINLTLPPMPYYSIDLDEEVIIRISLRELSYCSDDAFYIGSMRINKVNREKGELRQRVGSAYVIVGMAAGLFGGYQAALGMQIVALAGLTRCSAVSSMEIFAQSFRLFNPFAVLVPSIGVESSLAPLDSRVNAKASIRHATAYYDSLVGTLVGVLLTMGALGLLQIVLYLVAHFRYVGFSVSRRMGVFWIPSVWLMAGIANFAGVMFAAIQLLTNSGKPFADFSSHLGASYTTVGVVAAACAVAFALFCGWYPFLELQFEFHPIVSSASVRAATVGPYGQAAEDRRPLWLRRLQSFVLPRGIVMAHHVRRRFYPLVAYERQSPHDSAAVWRYWRRLLSFGRAADTTELDTVMADNKVAVGHLYSSVAWKASSPFVYAVAVGVTLVVYNATAGPAHVFSDDARYTYDQGGVTHSAVLYDIEHNVVNRGLRLRVSSTEFFTQFVERAISDPCARFHIIVAVIHVAAAFFVVSGRLYVTKLQMVAHAGSMLLGAIIFFFACHLSMDPWAEGAKDGIAIATILLIILAIVQTVSQWLAWLADYFLTQTLKDFNDQKKATASTIAANLWENRLLEGLGLEDEKTSSNAGKTAAVNTSSVELGGKDLEKGVREQWCGLVISPLRSWYHRGTWDRRLYNSTADEQYNLAIQQSLQRRAEFIVDFMNDSQPMMTQFEQQRVDMFMEMDDMRMNVPASAGSFSSLNKDKRGASAAGARLAGSTTYAFRGGGNDDLVGAEFDYSFRMLSPREVVDRDERTRRSLSRAGGFMPPPPSAVRYGKDSVLAGAAGSFTGGTTLQNKQQTANPHETPRAAVGPVRQKKKQVGPSGAATKKTSVPKQTPTRELDYGSPAPMQQDIEDM